MGRGNHSNGAFLAANLAEVAAASTVVDGVGFTSLVVECWDVKKLMLQGRFTGESGSTGAVTFIVLGRIKDGGEWDTVGTFTLAMTLVGTALVVESGQIDVQGFHSLKLYSIQNEDAALKALLVNLNWGKAYGAKDW